MSIKVLVVDDSRLMRMAVTRLLAGLDMAISEAADGREALEKLEREGVFDVVVLDWNMPVMNGYEFLVAMRGSARHADTKVVMLTTENQIESIRKALMAGANEYVMKPFTDEMLIEKIRMVMPEASI